MATTDPSRTGTLWTWPPPMEDLGQGRDQWQVFARAVERCGLGVPVTTDDPVPVWADRVRDAVTGSWNKPMPWQEGPDGVDPPIPDAYLTVTPGVGSVAVADLYALAPVIALSGVPLPENTAAGLRAWGRDRFGACTVRDMVGWLMAAAQAGVSDAPLDVIETGARWASVWGDQGHGAGGWWHLLGGLTIEEALAAARSGTADLDVARTMAALRGVRSPAGA